MDRVSGRLPVELAEARPATLSVTPLCHGYGLLNALLMIHSLGGLVILAEDARAEDIVRLIHDRDIRILYAWPGHFKRLGQRRLWPAALDNRLRWCVSSSMRLDADVAGRFETCSGVPVRQQYGTTESGPLCVDSGESPIGVQCVGLPYDGVEVAILDAAGIRLPQTREGRVAVRLTDAADPEWLRSGWYFPGDVGRLDELGRLHIHRRIESFFDERATV
jgi:acyl-coenzyme A synthetase/AMP-(fatty) acid ligase